MILFAFVDLVLLSLFFTAASYIDRVEIWELVIQYFVPFNVACCICFHMLYSKRADSQIVALLLCIVWTVIWIQIALNVAIYEVISAPVWITLLSLYFFIWDTAFGKDKNNSQKTGRLKHYGKTTLMRILCTLLKPSSGSVTWNRKDIFAMDVSFVNENGETKKLCGGETS